MQTSPTAIPSIPALEPANIPELLKQQKRWVPWWPGPKKDNGKFDKYPVDPYTGHRMNPVDPANWYSFEDVVGAYRRDMAKGIGFVLSDQHPVIESGKAFYLTAVDLDNCASRMSDLEIMWRELGKPYREVSPSLKGIRMLGLSSVPVRGGNAGDGRELYTNGRFMTVTGIGGRGTIHDITNGAVALEKRWFGARSQLPPQPVAMVPPALPETATNVAAVISMLDNVSSDTDYETWRAISWSLAQTGWACAPQLAHLWSARAPHRYDPAALDRLLTAFDPARGITLGTLAHFARKNGWTGPFGQLSLMQGPLPPAPPLPPPPPPPAPQSVQTKPLLTAAELRQLPTVPYVVRGLFPAKGLAAIYGEPGTGKSFVALSLGDAIASGAPDWFGFPILQTPVVYVALEGQGGIAKRTLALELHVKRLIPDAMRFWRSEIQLLTGEGIDALATQLLSELGTGTVVVIDTLNQASPGAEENSSQDMGKIISNSKRLAAAIDGLVILVHHAGKSRDKGLRGHSSLFAAMDVVIEVRRTASGREWYVTKSKDDQADQTRGFDLVPYTVGNDAFGAIASCAVAPTIHIRIPARRPPIGKHQKAALAELRRELSGPNPRAPYQEVLKVVAAVISTTRGKEHERAKEAVDALIRDGHLDFDNAGVGLA